MQTALEPFRKAHAARNAWGVARLLSPIASPDNPARLYNFYRATNEHLVENDVRHSLRYNKSNKFSNNEFNAWTDIFVSYWRAVGHILVVEEAQNRGRLEDRQLVDRYEAWRELANNFVKYFAQDLPSWATVAMYTTAGHLRTFAIRADQQLVALGTSNAYTLSLQENMVPTAPENQKLEEAARIFHSLFAACLRDRNFDPDDTRKWGVYYMANLQFKTFFRLRNINLSKNIIRSIDAQSDLPPFDDYPKAHRVTYKYYLGVIAIFQEDYSTADECLTEAWDGCLLSALKHQELILTYLIPCRLVTKHRVPSQDLLDSFPNLKHMYGPLLSCIKRGDISGFDRALTAGEADFVRRKVYLTLERGRDIAQRNLLRKVFLAAGFDDLKEGQTEADRIRKTRIPLAHFAAALKMNAGGEGRIQHLDDDEVECMVANMIYKGLMKGYISREHAMVVLNKKGAFPGTGV
ncbi:hypothetical protein EJ04DRAFT_461589 [Polyplosphaeria fusca]|uniref:Protein CSN12 homolog n=1 Tax=Polyplosphaeria fusca TaxID=682080 RepID=A0A9P4R0U0_9PLEO|nr:hypothetical protein EJ04DRAFT_461589 [Polyplosphaeria fusca]